MTRDQTDSVLDVSGPPTARQYRELHGVLRDIAEQAQLNGRGADAAKWKDYYKRKFIGTIDVGPDGQTSEHPLSTKTLTRAEFADFINLVRADAASEFGVIFPEWG